MKDQQTSPCTHGEMDTRLKKACYVSPVLRVYGAVSTLTMGNNGSRADKSNVTMLGASDRSIKESIVKLDDHPLKIGLYLFDYKPEYRNQWGHGRQFGVMAEEVEQILPESVSVHPDGYKMVNYGMLGISRNLH